MAKNLEAVAARARAIYAEHLRPMLETPENIGKHLIINTETGEWILGHDPDGADELFVDQEAVRQFPNAPLFGLRIGYPASDALGTILRQRSAA